jgi:hypothetical protein
VSRESVQLKAHRYLREARLTVTRIDEGAVRATCRGTTGIHDLGWTPGGGWSCSCPARRRCCHIAALQCVTVCDEGPA